MIPTDTTRRLLLRRLLLLSGLLSLCIVAVAQAAFFKLSGTMPAFGDVSTVLVSPNGQYTVYRADYDSDDIFNIFSVPLSGGTRVPLSTATLAGTGTSSPQISANSATVVYTSDQEADNVFQLYSVPITGPASAIVKLNLTLPSNGDVTAFKLTPDGTQVIYLADVEVDDRFELYRVPIAGPASAAQKISLPIAGTTSISNFAISPDGSRVVYEMRSCTISTCFGVIELYSVPIAGPPNAAIKIKEQLGGDVFSNFVFAISPDSSRVAYVDDQGTASTFELYSVSITGPLATTVKLNGPLVSNGDVVSFSNGFQFSSDSRQIVYQAIQDTVGVTELYSVPAAGPASAGIKLNKPLAGGQTITFKIAADADRVIYLADQDTAGEFELYSVPITGPASAGLKLNKPLPVGGNIGAFKLLPDSSRVIYTGAQDTATINEIYSVPISGPAAAGAKLNKPLVAGGNVSSFDIAADSNQVAYSADQETNGITELYSVASGGPATNGSKISGPMIATGSVNGFFIAPDSGRVLYTADQQTDGVFELYLADAGPPLVSFDASTLTVAETSGTAKLGVSLARGIILPASVQYHVTGGSATNGIDYTLAAGTLSFIPGQRHADISIALIGDVLREGSETITIVIESPTNALLGATVEQTVVISDGQVALPLVVK